MKQVEVLCSLCGKNPRDPYSKNCRTCRAEIKAGHQKKHMANQKKKRVARKATIPCLCGCGLPTVYPTRYATAECKAAGKAAALARTAAQRSKERTKLLSKPVSRPPTEKEIAAKGAEQARLDAEASAGDRAWHAKFMKNTLGLESAPGQPLASKVVTPPKEVWEELARNYQPMRDTGGMVLPFLHRDMVYD